jgi:hypothetical protein
MTRQRTELIVVKMPRALHSALEALAERHTENYTNGKIDLQNKFGDVAPDRNRLAPWVPAAKLVERELRRLERLKE